jgi:DNA-binding transcriptional MerR regulator
LVQSEVQTQLLRIDDLARLSGIPSRTIRFYNTQGLLPSPTMRGRVAYYNQEHVLVLGIIRELKEQQNLPLEIIKHLLEIRAQHGDVQMNLALKQRMMRAFSGGGSQVRLTQEELIQQAHVTAEQVHDLIKQGLLLPLESDEHEMFFTGDDLLLLDLYQRLEQLGLPLSLPALIHFQLRQLVRSEIAACEQHLLPLWREAGLPLEQQTQQFEQVLALTDTLISVMHRKLLYQG